jgi:hypothetical protein
MFIQPIKYQIRLIHYFFVNDQPPTINIDYRRDCKASPLSCIIDAKKINVGCDDYNFIIIFEFLKQLIMSV